MWQMISNISAIVTCFTFVLYLIGRILKTIASRDMIFERFEVVPFSNDSDTYNFDNELIIDKSGSVFFKLWNPQLKGVQSHI